MLTTPDQTPGPTTDSGPASKSQRVLACILCQQRKVKCDRRFPCANCTRHNVQCVPATQVRRPRRRRFPERELLDRVRHYEQLLKENNVKFEPLHGEQDRAAHAMEGVPLVGSDAEGDEEAAQPTPEESSPSKSESIYEARNIWHAIKQGVRGSHTESGPSESDGTFEMTWWHKSENDDLLLGGARSSVVDISTLHPEPAHLFRLWQIYLDNVDPLLKVTHTPTLQTRIIDAANNIGGMDSILEALMFGIYCMATLSLDPEECMAKFELTRDHLLAKYQFGCQQALLNCNFLRTSERDCLTALYLYLLSVRSGTDPRSMSSLLAVAVRIAQRIGIHDERSLAKHSVLEAEMRRRLWWSLVVFEDRIHEVQLAEGKTSRLTPTWHCRTPLNVNDSDLRVEAKTPPAAHDNPTEVLFAVVRSEMADFIRHTPMHIDVTNPILKPLARQLPGGGDNHLAALDQIIEEKYLRFCDPEIPLQCITLWMTRAQLAKGHLLELYAKDPQHPAQQTEAHHDAIMHYAFSAIECDTKILSSPGTHGYRWLLLLYFPFPAYVHLVQSLRRQPLSSLAARAWEVMGDNYEARFGSASRCEKPPFRMLARAVLDAWEATEEAYLKQQRERGQDAQTAVLEPPRMVTSARAKLADMAQAQAQATPSSGLAMSEAGGMGIDNLSLSRPPMAASGDFWKSGGTAMPVTGAGYENVTMFGTEPPGLGLDPMSFMSEYWGFENQKEW